MISLLFHLLYCFVFFFVLSLHSFDVRCFTLLFWHQEEHLTFCSCNSQVSKGTFQDPAWSEDATKIGHSNKTRVK